MVESFTNLQRLIWLKLAKCGVFRYYISLSQDGTYSIQQFFFGKILFWIFCANNVSKFIYHILTYHELLGVEVNFMDQMGMWDWFLMYAHVFFECFVWFFKYPMWENLYRQWELQEDIYRKLGRPEQTARKIMMTDIINFVIYGGVCAIGTIAYAIQFFYTPKYVLNTYAIITQDNFFLRVLFCLHECSFLGHGYCYQAFTMVLAESYAVSYEHLLEEMNKALVHILEYESSAKVRVQRRVGLKLRGINLIKSPNLRAPGTAYDIRSLIEDYKKITISAQFHNQWIGYIMGIPQGINYGQFVSDVFMLIQLLQEPETDYTDVFFYIMDAVFGMIMIFRMLILLSRLHPQAEKFILGLKIYASLNTPLRKEILKTIRSMRVVSAKLTGYTVRPRSVPKGINILINWYIAAAMWKRPDDPSRRT